MTDTIYRWRFNTEDENGEHHDLSGDEDFIGTEAQAEAAGESAADAWEEKTGGLAMQLELERRGAVTP